jgi:hypothetical protein
MEIQLKVLRGAEIYKGLVTRLGLMGSGLEVAYHMSLLPT